MPGRTGVSKEEALCVTTRSLKMVLEGYMCLLCRMSSRLKVSTVVPMQCKYKHSGFGQTTSRMKYEQYLVVPKVALILRPSSSKPLVAWIHVEASFSV